MDAASSGCYCCPKPMTASTSTSHSAMDLDSALNELGMLSSVTDSRRQFLQERARDLKNRVYGPRGRNLSEPSLSGAGTPSNSPTKGGSVCQVIQINSQFVSSLSTGLSLPCSPSSSPNSLLKPNPVHSPAKECLDFGEKYKQVELEQDARANRLSRLKVARVRRFRRPYELPWRTSLQQSHNNTETSLIYAVNPDQFLGISTPEKIFRPADNVVVSCNSNASTPEKARRSNSGDGDQSSTWTRSKSLDDLDLSKLQLAETENHHLMQERKEIDHVSEHLKDLHVQE